MSSHEERLPDRIGPYEVEDFIGQGGMGVVYRGWDPRLDRKVALKALPAKMAMDEGQRARLEREARVLAALADRNIASILGLEEHEGRLFLVLEHVEGESLEERLSRGPIPLAETLRIGVQIAGGLVSAHARAIVHRDLKPGNVMLTPEGGVKLIDFGLARETTPDPLRAGPVTGNRMVVGTIGYMSPEQLAGAGPDARDDIWGFGCLLFECLAGHAALPGRDDSDRVRLTLDAAIDWSRLPAEIPERLLRLLRRCLERDVSRRPGDLAPVLSELRTLLAKAEGRGETRPWSSNRGSTPAALTSFIGRSEELSRLESALRRMRLVTLVGAGGCGKTRLAMRAAEQADRVNDVHFVDLAPLGDERLVAARVASALGIAEELSRSAEEQLIRSIGGRELLLVLDNCEHLLSSTASLAERLLATCPRLRILATSREGLASSGEHVLPLQPLGLPELDAPYDRILESESVQLFLERARAVRPDFEPDESDRDALARICRRLDGLPLALELAAARLRVLNLRQLDERLEDRFRVLSGGRRTALPRQQTLEATLDWSHDLLDDDERVLLRRLSVFAASFSIEAAEAVCSDETLEAEIVLDVLARLVEKSLLLVQTGEERARYRLLETVRQYAGERLIEAGEVGELVARHRASLVELAERLEGELKGPGRAESLALLAREHDDIRAALATAERETDGHARLERLRLAVALRLFWGMRGDWTEGRGHLETALECAGDDAPPRLRAQALVGIGRLALSQGELDSAGTRLEEALELWRELRDPKGVAATLNGLSIVAREQGRPDEAETLLAEVLELARESGDHWNVAVALNARGNISQSRGDLVGSRPDYQESLRLFRELGGRAAISAALLNLGTTSFAAGDIRQARDHLSEGLELARGMGNRSYVSTALESIGTIERACGRLPEAERAYAECLAIRQELLDRQGIATIHGNLGRLRLAQGRIEEARISLEESLALHAELDDDVHAAPTLRSFAQLHLLERDHDSARARLAQAREISSSRRDELGAAESGAIEARLLLAEGRHREARTLIVDCLSRAHELGNRPEIRRALEIAAESCLAEGDAMKSGELAGTVEQLGEDMGAGPEPHDGPHWALLMAGLASALERDELEAAKARGRKLCLADAIARVRGDL